MVFPLPHAQCLQWAVVMAQCVCIYSVETILAALVYGISIAPCSVLAVGGSDGSVCVYSVEDGNALHRFSAGAPVTHLSWRQLDDIEWVEIILCGRWCLLFISSFSVVGTLNTSKTGPK